ncbi:MAG: sugar ABC transporter permease [Clostridia bacterium]|nr:sugar ABC transporter permease [Clostridia bacterium]
MSAFTKKRKDYRLKSKIFYAALMAFPILQFCVFYIGVNFNSILLAFQNITISTDPSIGQQVSWGFNNFTEWFTIEGNLQAITTALSSSFTVYLISLFTGVPLGLLFSYYIYKKLLGSGMFRVFLFLPSIVSAIVMVLIFKYCVNEAVPTIIKQVFGVESMKGLLSNPETRFGTIVFYNIYVSFGTSVLMYSNKMAGISPEIIEAGHIDGVSQLQEFWHVVLPLTFPTLSIFLVTGVATLFTNQFNMYSFYGGIATVPDDKLITLGFYLYSKAQSAGIKVNELPPLSALGLMMTLVAVPLTFTVRWALDKFGPSED